MTRSRWGSPLAYFAVSILSAGCASPGVAPAEPQTAPEMEMRVACKGDRVSRLAITVDGPGSFMVPVDLIAEKFCNGA